MKILDGRWREREESEIVTELKALFDEGHQAAKRQVRSAHRQNVLINRLAEIRRQPGGEE